MTLLKRGNEVYSTTCLSVPVDLKEDAQRYNINMSGVFVKALKQELQRKKEEIP